MTQFLTRYRRVRARSVLHDSDSGRATQNSAMLPTLREVWHYNASSPYFITARTRNTTSVDDEQDNTNNVEIERELMELIRTCNNMNGSSQDSLSFLKKKVADCLSKIYEIVSGGHFFGGVRIEVRRELFAMLSNILLHPVQPVPLHIVYSDSNVIIFNENWFPMSIAHKILYSLVANSDMVTMKEYITMDLIRDFSDLLGTQDRQEQQVVESLITLLFDMFKCYRTDIFKLMVGKIKRYIESVGYYPAVAPSLRIILYFLRSQRRPLEEHWFQFYKKEIFTLISTQMAHEFFPQIHQIMSFFMAQNRLMAIWSLRYLKNYWPKTDTKKSCDFLFLFQYIIPCLQQSEILEAGIIMFSLLNNVLQSPNFNVALVALQVLQDNQFLKTFSLCSEQLLPLILCGLNHCCHHWSFHVVKGSIDVGRKLLALNSPALSSECVSRAEVERKHEMDYRTQNWISIGRIAANNYNDIKIDFLKNCIS